MDTNLEIYHKVLDRVNSELRGSRRERKEVFYEVQQEDTLAVTLRLHLYAEKELDEIIKVLFNKPKIVNGFSNKLNLLFNLQIIDKPLFDAVSKLNTVRNAFAHDLYYAEKKNVYSDLKSGLSEHILREHEIDLEMTGIHYDNLDEEDKIRILLSDIWIQLRIFSTSALLKKYEFANRLREEVIEEVNRE